MENLGCPKNDLQQALKPVLTKEKICTIWQDGETATNPALRTALLREQLSDFRWFLCSHFNSDIKVLKHTQARVCIKSLFVATIQELPK